MFQNFASLIVLSTFQSPLTFIASAFQCLNEEGEPVDSWIVLSQNSDYQCFVHNELNGFELSPYNTSQTEDGPKI
jgi:hypothetical protein